MDAEQANSPRAAMLDGDAVAGTSPMSSDIRIEDHFTGAELQLARAAGTGDTTQVKRLVEQGADPDAVSAGGMPLILWPLHRENLDGLKALLAAGANPDQRARTPEGQGGSPVVIWAARQQDAASPRLKGGWPRLACRSIMEPSASGRWEAAMALWDELPAPLRETGALDPLQSALSAIDTSGLTPREVTDVDGTTGSVVKVSVSVVDWFSAESVAAHEALGFHEVERAVRYRKEL